MSTLLVVDDEQSICWGLTRLGESMGHKVFAASSAEQALAAVGEQRPDIVVLDVRLPGLDGISAIERFQELCGRVPIIVVTAYGDLQTAVEAVRRGAFDYIAKPFDVAKVKAAVARALASRPALDEPEITSLTPRVEGMVGRSPVMQEVFKQIALASSSDAATLLQGESGTGKELAARAIHRYSVRADGPFVAVNVASLSPSLAESELFGHVRGAFTGADAARTGLLVQAHGGTLFLDEVADIPQHTQVKLLRALEHGEVVPVGGRTPVATNFRVISATHRDLARQVAEGSFRHDLFFRLCAFQVNLPPLRERPEDIAELAEHFASSLAKTPGTPPAPISREVIAAMEHRTWRGNVRELRNAMAHALIMARGRTIMPEHLPEDRDLVAPGLLSGNLDEQMAAAVRAWVRKNMDDPRLTGRLYDRFLEVVESTLFEVALNRHRGQCATAARALGIHRTTLRKKLDAHGLEPDGGRDE